VLEGTVPSSPFVEDVWTRHDGLFNPNGFPDLAAVRLKWAEVDREQVEFVNRVTNESSGRMLPVRTTQISLADLTQNQLPSRSSRANDAAACR
jgi:hypothetical protein